MAVSPAHDLLKMDVQNHAKTLSVMVIELRDIKDIVEQLVIDKAVKKEQDRSLDDRLKRIEDSIAAQTASMDRRFKSIVNIGIWALSIFGGAIVLVFTQFIIRGGIAIVDQVR